MTCLYLVPGGGALAGNWPQWRGPLGTGVSDETGLPVEWSESSGIAWKCDLPGWGNSTPAIWGDAVFVTSQEGDDLLLVKVSKKSGSIEWTRKVGSSKLDPAPKGEKDPQRRGTQDFHATQNMASPSPVTDGERVIVHFGSGDIASYDFAGERRWARNLQKDHGTYTIWWGHANSPVLHGDLVISVCMQDSLKDIPGKSADSYVVAHDKRTGAEKWKTLRMTGAASEPCDSYTTPIFHETGGRTEMLVVGGTWIDAYDPATGKQLWYLPGIGGNRTITGPTVSGDMLYTVVGMRGPLLAVKIGGSGKLSGEAILWKHAEGTPDSGSPVVWGDLVFIASDGGIASCLDATSGKLHWKQRLSSSNRASPLAAEGRVYFVGMDAVTTVVAASAKFEKIAENRLSGETFSSLAVSDGRMYLRCRKALYCIERKRE
jgi:outer membrane protein assembly factor BamB